jgi:hypothetical protein
MHMLGGDSNPGGISTFKMHSRGEDAYFCISSFARRNTASSYAYYVGDNLVMHNINLRCISNLYMLIMLILLRLVSQQSWFLCSR